MIEEELDQETPPESLFVVREAFDALQEPARQPAPAAACAAVAVPGRGQADAAGDRPQPLLPPLPPAGVPRRVRPAALRAPAGRAGHAAPGHAAPLHHRLPGPVPRAALPVVRGPGGGSRPCRAACACSCRWCAARRPPSPATCTRAGPEGRLQAPAGRHAARRARPRPGDGPHRPRGAGGPGPRPRAAPLRAADAFTALFRAQIVALVDALAPNGALAEEAFAHLTSAQDAAPAPAQGPVGATPSCAAPRTATCAPRTCPPPSTCWTPSSPSSATSTTAATSCCATRTTTPSTASRRSWWSCPGRPKGPASATAWRRTCARFAQTLETTFHAVSRRSLLQGRGFDRPDAEALRDRFLPPAHR